jgi:hypothetical protein
MSILFDTTQRLIIVPAEVFGPLGSRSVRLALDTAATETVISRRVLAILGYTLASSRSVPVIMGSGVTSVPLITLDGLEALDQTQSGITVQAHTLPVSLPVDGLLGLDFIRGQRLVIDYRTSEITLT